MGLWPSDIRKKTDEIITKYVDNPIFSELIGSVEEVNRQMDELRDAIEGYTNAQEDEASLGKNAMPAYSLAGLVEFARETADSLDSLLSYFEPDLENTETLSEKKRQQLESELDDVQLEFTGVGWAVYNYLIGSKFVHEWPDKIPSVEEKVRPSHVSSEKITMAYKRALCVAQSDWADPNQRCAAITIALALLIHPNQVLMTDSLPSKAIDAKYGVIEVPLWETPSKTNFRFSIHVRTRSNSGAKHVWLPDLAETYADHIRNVETKEFLDRMLPLTGGVDQVKAAVLGLAWAMLQRESISHRDVIATSDKREIGFHTFALDGSLCICVDKDTIAMAKYPGLPGYYR